MSLSSPVQRRLDSAFVDAQSRLDEMAQTISEGEVSPADTYAFYEASMDYSNANWAAGQMLSVKHGLAKAIINDFN
ncbi:MULTISPECIES: type III secretion protein HrpF [Dickeya]|uniref:Type III secretion protein HrpF n=1 Tax=Dickeya oryzae TaxID=1240404 RepID=A0AB39I4Y7_9GAMM|nr:MULTISPECIES: type III secretion protein HrpF [Dickeya]AJC66516.1 HPr kinase [Dickeya zeae EC1]UUE08219.1 type III secretion protein HrpF [Dickeya zeae]MBP2844536.1 type III secretion protein HrpF [Dickeya oryzae]MBP2851532.1 type III secretion protein HrpF [Dickeya oryzae]MBP2858192.1 type III secretion protein HrpF [Dickeya oryzae]